MIFDALEMEGLQKLQFTFNSLTMWQCWPIGQMLHCISPHVLLVLFLNISPVTNSTDVIFFFLSRHKHFFFKYNLITQLYHQNKIQLYRQIFKCFSALFLLVGVLVGWMRTHLASFSSSNQTSDGFFSRENMSSLSPEPSPHRCGPFPQVQEPANRG